MKKLCKSVIPAVCAALALVLCLAGCADGGEYDAKDLSDAGVSALAYEGSFTIRKTETEVSTFSDDWLTEGRSSLYELTESYDADGGCDVRIEATSITDYMLEKAFDEDGMDTEETEISFTEGKAYFVPYTAGSSYGTQYLYTLTDGMEEAMTSASDAQSESRRLSDDLETFGIRFSDFTFREMYTTYLEDILIHQLDADEENITSGSYSETNGENSNAVTYYEFTAECTYFGDFDGGARIALSFEIEDGLIIYINFNLYQERVTDFSGFPFEETLEYSSCCDVAYEYDADLMLTEMEKVEYYSG